MSSAIPSGQRPLKVFLCHSSGDKPRVRDLYRRLKEDGFQPWLDEMELKPGAKYKPTIEDTLRDSDAVVVCISAESVAKESFVNREIRVALEVADEKPDGTIFLIPARLEEVPVPRSLRELHWANLYEVGGYENLVAALKVRANKVAATSPSKIISSPATSVAIGVPSPTRTALPLRATLHALWGWMGTHRALGIGLPALVWIAAGVVSYKLYADRQMERAKVREQFTQLMRSFNPVEARFVIGQAVKVDSGNARLYGDLAVSSAEQGNYERALGEAEGGLSHTHWWNKRDRAWVNGVFKEMKWELGDAAKFYREGWKKYGDPEAGLRLTRVQSLSGHGKEALETVQELKGTPAVASDPRIEYEEASALNSEADFKAVYQNSAEAYKDVVKRLNEIAQNHEKETLILIIVQSQKCWVLYEQGLLDEAADACKKALENLDLKNDDLWRARTLTRQSLILARRSEKYRKEKAIELQGKALNEASDLQERAWKIASDLHSQIDEAGALQNRANLWMLKKDYPNANKDFIAASDVYKSIHSQQGLAAIGNNQAAWASELCSYKEAEANFEKAREAYRDSDSPEGVALAGSNVGSMLYLLGDLKGAEKRLKEALQSAHNLNLQVDTENWLILLGEVYLAKGQLPDAEQCFRLEVCYDDSRPAKADREHHPVSTDAAADYALLQIAQGDARAAEIALRESMRQSAGDWDADENAAALDALTRALLAQRDKSRLAEARGFLLRASTFDYKSCALKASLGNAAAKVSAQLADHAHPGQIEEAKRELDNAMEISKGKDLLGQKFEALLVQADLDFLSGQLEPAERQATDLSTKAGAAGFNLIKADAERLLKEIKTRQIH
jgi:hypothetical protein